MTRIYCFAALLAGCASAVDADGSSAAGVTGTTVTFQTGANGYSGTRDVSISTEYGGNGVTTTSGEMMAWKLDYEERALIRFDGLSLPAGATVTAASLTLTFDNWSTGFTVNGAYVSDAWNPTSPALGWITRDTGVGWTTPGGDAMAGKSFAISGFAGTGVEVKTAALDPAVVQGWVNSPSTNQGVLLVNQTANAVTRIYSSEDGTVARHPKLIITYTTGPSCPSATAGAAFVNNAMTAQTGSFTASFDATPSAVIDGVIALASGAPSAFSGLAAIARFNSSGTIDARNGGSYAAAAGVAYAGGTSYHFRLPVDVAHHTYSIYVTPAGGSEQLIGSNFAFRTEQATVGSLDDWTLDVDSTSGTLQVCNFSVSNSGVDGGVPGDTTPPTVTLTAPASGSTLSGKVTLSANAGDNVGVAGVQFLVDGANAGAEEAAAPFTLSFDTTTLSNGSHNFAARARDAAGNRAASSVTATVNNSTTPPPSGHPRIWLDAGTLSAMKAKAQAGNAQWTTLRNACNSYLSGTVQYPDGNDYPNLPNIGEGYQGSDYIDPLFNIGMCYQIGLQINDSNTAQWGQKGADILEKMSNPTHSPAFSRDDGYGIRFFGVGMAVGYDWLWGALSASLKSQVYNQLNGWLSWWDTSGFEHDHPNGNYFAGYYAAKAYAGIATDGDNPSAATLWGDFLNRMHNGGANSVGSHTGVAAYYAKYMVGGGWSEGWGYGPLAAVNMSLPSLAAKTGKGVDLIANGYSYPLDNGQHLIQFTWPSLASLDDRDLLHSGADLPAAPSAYTTTVVAGLLGRYNHALAPQFHAYARAIRARTGNAAPWVDLLFWDDSAAEQPYTTLPLSYFSRGLNVVAMRSDWSATATFASMRASAFVDYDGASEQLFDSGSLAIVRGGMPFVVNSFGFLDSTLNGSSTYENNLLDECFSGSNPRRIFNTFYNGSSGQFANEVDNTPAPKTRMGRYEDGGSWVMLSGDDLQDMYPSSDAVSAWSRELVYLRPNQFVVYDRTAVSTISDEHLNWHVISTPSSVSATRWDVSNASSGFMGAMTTVLPASAQVSSVNVFSSNKVYRLEVRAPSPAADMRWLTVFDAAASSAAVAAATRLTTSSNVNGALLTSASGNAAVLFGANGTISGAVTFSEPAAATRVVIADLAPNTSYSVSVAVSGGNHSVTVQPGSGFTSSANGTLAVSISAAGSVVKM